MHCPPFNLQTQVMGQQQGLGNTMWCDWAGQGTPWTASLRPASGVMVIAPPHPTSLWPAAWGLKP